MKKIVVKIGSSVIAPTGKLDSSLMGRIVKDILEAEMLGWKVVLVSSGAIACGLNLLKQKKKPQDMPSLMAFSSLGQIILMGVYVKEFKKHKKYCAQILLTWDDFDKRERFLNARYTINKLFNLGIIPVINENDAVSFEEIKFGDNDRLSALVGDLMGAEILIILSDVEGVMKEGRVIKEVPKVDSEILCLAKKEDKVFTQGGMIAKLEAAKIATSAGIKTIIAQGRINNVICRILRGENLGTVFLPCEKIGKARDRWIAFSKKIKGRVYIDDGARDAVIYKGKSLLGPGITRIEGEFRKKDAVRVYDEQGNFLGCGLINYSCEELQDYKQKKFEKEIIHRNNFVKAV